MHVSSKVNQRAQVCLHLLLGTPPTSHPVHFLVEETETPWKPAIGLRRRACQSLSRVWKGIPPPAPTLPPLLHTPSQGAPQKSRAGLTSTTKPMTALGGHPTTHVTGAEQATGSRGAHREAWGGWGGREWGRGAFTTAAVTTLQGIEDTACLCSSGEVATGARDGDRLEPGSRPPASLAVFKKAFEA